MPRSVVSADFPELTDEPEAASIPGRVRYRHDPRLMIPSDTYFTPEQSNAMVTAIKCQTLLMTSGDGGEMNSTINSNLIGKDVFLLDNGWPFSHHDMKANEDILSQKVFLFTNFTCMNHTPCAHSCVVYMYALLCVSRAC